MAFTLSSIQKGQIIEPPRILTYGGPGIGKTTWASEAPRPIFVPTEKGRGVLDIESFPLAKSFGDVMDAIRSLLSEEHEYQTAVFDTIDWLEPLIWAQVCADGGKNTIEDFGYGKGYVIALDYWSKFLEALDELHDKGMIIILLGHSLVKLFNNPEGDNYDQYQLTIHQKAAAMLKEWVDAMLFANLDVKIRKVEGGIQKDKGKAVKSHVEPPRLLFTEDRPAYHAKNRYALPTSIPLSWQAFEEAMDAGIASQTRTVKKLSTEKAATA